MQYIFIDTLKHHKYRIYKITILSIESEATQ